MVDVVISGEPDLSLARVEREYILKVLRHTEWHKGRAATILGVDPATLYRKLLRYGALKPPWRTPRVRPGLSEAEWSLLNLYKHPGDDYWKAAKRIPQSDPRSEDIVRTIENWEQSQKEEDYEIVV